MRRFSFYRRGKTFYVRFWDEETKSYTPGMSTGETNEKAAYAAVYHYENHGELPGRAGDIDDRVTVHRIVKQLRAADLDPSDATRIVAVLRDRGLIVSSTIPRTDNRTRAGHSAVTAHGRHIRRAKAVAGRLRRGVILNNRWAIMKIECDDWKT